MKKIIIAMAAIAAAFTTASCNKEPIVEPVDNPAAGQSVITASIENDLTKTTLEGNDTDGYKVFWSMGDDIFVCDGEMNWVAEYKVEDSSVGSSKGIFSWHTGDFFLAANDNYKEPVFEKGNVYGTSHPSDLVDLDNFRLVWKTEQAYTEMYIPMFAETTCTKDGEADFIFTNLGGLLRLTVKGTAIIKSIELRAAEVMSGVIDEIAYEGDGDIVFMKDATHGGINYITLDCGIDGVELNNEEGVDFYFSLPCCYDSINCKIDGYSGVTITLTDTEDKICVKTLKNENGLVIERSQITTASFTASEFKATIPEGALPGKFTINKDGDQVYFSKGNLYYDGNAFKFEENQYDFQSSWDLYYVSHFYWSENAKHAYAEELSGLDSSRNFFTNAEETTAKSDFTVNGVTGKYRTLSEYEWTYLFDNHSYKWVTAGGVNGYVIAPDGFSGTLADSYADDAALAADNLVFLPAAGQRSYTSGAVEFLGEGTGFYWSSNLHSEREAFYLEFKSNIFYRKSVASNYGMSVRLVTNVTE